MKRNLKKKNKKNIQQIKKKLKIWLKLDTNKKY